MAISVKRSASKYGENSLENDVRILDVQMKKRGQALTIFLSCQSYPVVYLE